MAGIRTKSPVGPDWEYSLDEVTWQTSPVFSAQPSGDPFILGEVYQVFCRNLVQDLSIQNAIVFGEDSSEPTLLNLAKRASPAMRQGFLQLLFGYAKLTLQAVLSFGAEANILPVFNGGISGILPDEPAGASYPVVVVGTDKQLYARRPIVAPPVPVFQIVAYWEEVDDVLPPIVLPPVYRLSVDINNCPIMTGWVADTNHPDTPTFVRILRDGVEVGRATAQIPRPDVKSALLLQGIPAVSNIFGWEFQKPPSTSLDGVSHTWTVFGGDSQTEAQEYNVSKTLTCAVPISPTTPIDHSISGLNSIDKAGQAEAYTLFEKLFNGVQQEYTAGVPAWSVVGSPAGISLSVPSGAPRQIQVQALASTAVDKITLQAVIPGFPAVTFPISIRSADCVRPVGLTSYKLSWHYSPVSDPNDVRRYGTLEDANTVAGKKFDNSRPVELYLFDAQAANLEVGTKVYNGLSTSCGLVSTNLYSVFDSIGGNTVRKSIQVVDGFIVAVLASTYTVSINHPPVCNYSSLFRAAPIAEQSVITLPMGPDQFTDEDGDPLTYSIEFSNEAYTNSPADQNVTWGPQPAWSSVTSNVWTFTPPAPFTNHYQIRVTCSDGRGGVCYDRFLLLISVPPTT